MLSFSQSKGHISRDGQIIGLGYAGMGDGLLNPGAQTKPNVGPLPRGLYTLKKVDQPHMGPLVFRLLPDAANIMFNRSDFFIHWDNRQQNFTASEGCIVPVTAGTFYRFVDGELLTVVA